jgi:hypothetical protein
MYNILMMSKPGGDRGPSIGYINHINALNSDSAFNVNELEKISDISQLQKYDYFWFYVRFDPKLYYYIKENFPDKKIICGHNVLLEKPESVPSDPWESWFLQNVNFDLQLNSVKFYSDYVKTVVRKDLQNKTQHLNYCLDMTKMDWEPYSLKNSIKKPVLIYSKNRRIDKNYFAMFKQFINKIKSENIDHSIVEYGNYDREDFLNSLKKYSCCITLSHEDYPGYAMLEAMAKNIPVLGTRYSIPQIFDENFWFEGQTLGPDWIERDDSIFIESAITKIKKFKSGDLVFKTTPRKFIETQYNFSKYIKDLKELLANV